MGAQKQGGRGGAATREPDKFLRLTRVFFCATRGACKRTASFQTKKPRLPCIFRNPCKIVWRKLRGSCKQPRPTWYRGLSMRPLAPAVKKRPRSRPGHNNNRLIEQCRAMMKQEDSLISGLAPAWQQAQVSGINRTDKAVRIPEQQGATVIYTAILSFHPAPV